MKKMKKSFSFGKIVLLLVCLLSIGIAWILGLVSKGLIEGLETEKMATRWKKDGGVAQISCFYSVNTRVTPDSLEEFEHTLDNALEEASITVTSPNANARLWADAYSATGQVSVKSNLSEITVDAMGIGGDFFLFHPLQLLSGSYFSGNDVMQDYCVLDQDAAWKLFGSNDVCGQIVYIGNVAHIVTGVVKREESDLYKAAGLDNSLIYVSYSTLEKYGRSNGINHFEIVMPNPVKGYAKGYIEEAIGVAESEREIVVNSERFSVLNRIKHINKLSNRAMNGKAIIYPYWENVARATEDKLAVLMIFQLIFLLISSIIVFIVFIVWWKNRKWTLKSLLLKAKDSIERKFSGARTKSKYKRMRKQREL